MASTQMQSPADVLAALGPGVGLCGELAPFAGGSAGLPLAQRLAEHPLLMAPMAGVTDSAYRMMARAGGADLAYSEMVSCAGLHYGGEKTWELVDVAPGEPDLAVQLFGTKPELFAEAAAGVAERLGERLVLIDINMACPVPKVTKKGEGAALMETPELAASLVAACAGTVDVPVTVKIRRGRRDGAEVAPEFARRMADAGAQAVAVHGRYATHVDSEPVVKEAAATAPQAPLTVDGSDAYDDAPAIPAAVPAAAVTAASPAVTGSVAPVASSVEKDFSGFGDAADDFEIDDLD